MHHRKKILILSSVLVLLAVVAVITIQAANRRRSDWKGQTSFAAAFTGETLYCVKNDGLYRFDPVKGKGERVYASSGIHGILSLDNELVMAEESSLAFFDTEKKMVTRTIPLTRSGARWTLLRRLSDTKLLLDLSNPGGSPGMYYVMDLIKETVTPLGEELPTGSITLSGKKYTLAWETPLEQKNGNQKLSLTDGGNAPLVGSGVTIKDVIWQDGLIMLLSVEGGRQVCSIYDSADDSRRTVENFPAVDSFDNCCLAGNYFLMFDPGYGGRVIVYELSDEVDHISSRQINIL